MAFQFNPFTGTFDIALPGTPGADGASAYEVAVAQGFVGTEAEWLATLEGPEGPMGPMGSQGIGIQYVGSVPTVADLPATATQGDLYIVEEFDPNKGFVWDATTSTWTDSGPVQGPQGVPGIPGPTAVSTDPDNISILGTDGLVFTKIPYPQAMALGGVFASYPQANKYISAINGDGTVLLADLPAAGTNYVLPIASPTILGGVKVGANLTIDASGVLNAAGGADYTLPIASATVLGGIKIGAGLTIDAAGVVTANAASVYVNKAGDVMNGPLRWSAYSGALNFNGTDAYLYRDTAFFRLMTPGGTQAFRIDMATGDFAIPNKLDVTGTTNFTGTATFSQTQTAFQFGTTGYNVFGGTGGVAFRSGTTNISTFTNASITNTVPIVTSATGNGIQFGSGGAAFKRGTAAMKIAATGAIELPGDPVAAMEAATKQYVDAKVIATAAGATAPAVSGVTAGTLWVEYA